MNNHPLHTISDERRFPNEVSAIIIENLGDDFRSLRKTALVCKDFVSLSQEQIFRHVFVSGTPSIGSAPDSLPLTTKFLNILLNPQTTALGRFVRRLDFWPGPVTPGVWEQHSDAFLLIIQNLPSLIDLRVAFGYRGEVYFRAIGEYLGSQLKELWIKDHNFNRGDFLALRNMLSSLAVLKFLAISTSIALNFDLPTPADGMALILPRSLRVIYLQGVDEYILHIVGLGMKLSRPPLLHTLFVTFSHSGDDLSPLWEGIGANTRVILDVDNGSYYRIDGTNMSDDNFAAFYEAEMAAFARGIKCTQLTFYCSQLDFLIIYFAHFIPKLPATILEICIDFNACASDGPPDHPEADPRNWTKLDGALMRRYELGLLKCLTFRCTTRMISGRGYSNSSGPTVDRMILDRVRSLLPISERAGILDVDYTTLVNELF
ncbi:hypothetical protein BT96DRAFT_913231 [Gymnopus androsaceus JB14]|uniref:F-box domain-containing protein n=1 Tax=Gymnopus androsaceus JB14 TaxID=1447944 RepID=A0A6A4ILK3_9AGAR|nr:hypothetical protein BT96DRAFT_913231 [Gymnopus androsaceus JB14]